MVEPAERIGERGHEGQVGDVLRRPGHELLGHVATDTNGLPAGTIIACGDLTAGKPSGKSKLKKPHLPHANGPEP